MDANFWWRKQLFDVNPVELLESIKSFEEVSGDRD